jgi:hypothetical protein
VTSDKENTQMDVSDNFHNMINFVQVDHFLKKLQKSASYFLHTDAQKPLVTGKIFQLAKLNYWKKP